MSSRRRLVVIGHGVAGLTAAGAARDQEGDLNITLVGDEPYDAYYRPRLTHDLATGIDAAKIRLRPPAWYDGARIEVLHGVTAVRLDTSARLVELDTGGPLEFDTLVLATGSSGFIPLLPGSAPTGVYTLRSAVDAEAIRTRAQGAATAAIAGGGLLGLEAAYGLAKLGTRVVVLERGASLLRRQLDRDGGDLLAELLRRAAIEIWTGAEVESTLGATGIEGVVLKDGRRLDCGLLLVAAGVSPNVALAKAAGIATDRGGVVVDDRMTTSVPVVFACGDVASHRTGNFSIWPQAMAQGKVAGANAAGGAASYGGVVPQNLLNVAGTSVLAAGEVGAEGGSGRGGGGRGGGGRGDGAGGGDLADETGRSEVFRLDREQGKYAKFVFRGETIVGVMLIGEPALAQPAARAVQAGHTVQGLDAVPSAGQFDYVVERITRS